MSLFEIFVGINSNNLEIEQSGEESFEQEAN
jgi:hypothetical protein